VNITTQEDHQYMGIESLVPADQHTHLVSETMNLDGFAIELNDWHFGSDMAKFFTDKNVPIAGGWMVAFDCERKKCEIEYLVIIEDENIKKSFKGSNENLAAYIEKLVAIIENNNKLPNKEGLVDNLKKVVQLEEDFKNE